MEAGQIKTVIERALVSFTGQATSDGNVGGTTVVCSTLPAVRDFDGQKIIIADGACAGEARDIDGATTGGTVTVTPAFSAQIVAGVNFYITTDLPMTEEAAAISAELAKVPKSDAAVTWNATALASVNGEVDKALDTAIPGSPTADSINERVKNIDVSMGTPARSLDTIIGARWDSSGDLGTDVTSMLASLTALIASGLAYKGAVTTATDTTHFKASALLGYGNGYFKNWYAYALWDAGGAGAAPQGEAQPISAYLTADGDFTHTVFTAQLALTDLVLIIHPAVAYMLGLTPARAGYLDELAAANIPADVDTLKADLGNYSGQSNLTSLLAALGIPDTTGKPLYTCLITDRLDDATFGLSNLQGLIAALQTDLDNATDGLGALKALIDALNDISTAQVNTEVDNALDTAIPGSPTANSINERIKTMDDTTLPAIQGLVDSAESAGPFSYLDAGGEQTVVEDTAVTRRRIWLEFSNRNMTQTGTFKLYRKVDGTNYDLYASQPVTVAAGDDRAFDAEFTTNQAWKLTYEEDADEGAARDIPFNVITQVIE